MKEIIDWLITVEHLASELYSQAADLFAENKSLNLFLKHNAEDEAYHYHIMVSASEYLSRSNIEKPASIIICNTTKARIEAPFKKSMALLAEKKLTKEILLDCIIDSEFSEWNDIFLYVINVIKEEDSVFAYSAAKIQHHLKHIEHYLNSTEYGKNKLDTIKTLPRVWKEKILLVDDDSAILSLLSAILGKKGEIDLAFNGREALSKIKETYYDLVISDIDMPIMNGLELFEQASQIIDNLNDKFIFHSGNISPEKEKFFRQNKVRSLRKPSTIKEIHHLVDETLNEFTFD